MSFNNKSNWNKRPQAAKEKAHGVARVISKRGFCSRSQAENLVLEGRVSLRGKIVRDPDAPARENDEISVDGKIVKASEFVYFMMNKPRGYVTTASDEKGRATVMDLFREEFAKMFPGKPVPHISPVGRLDAASEGLLLFTNDTQWADALLQTKDDKCVERAARTSLLGHDRVQHLGLEQSESPKTRDESGEVESLSEGVILSEAERSRRIQCGAPSVTREDLERVLPQFIGDIDQVPPNYCAVKINGHRASDLMNRGREIELKPRRIHISSLKVIGEGLVTEGCTGKCFATFDLECNCSKGTYIRSLGRDLARALGTCGCVSKIRRHRIGDVTVDRAVRGDELTSEHLLPVDQVLDFPVVRLNDDQVKAIRLGNWVPWRTPVENLSTTPGAEKFVFTADKNGAVVGLGVYDPGRICPKFFLGEDE